MAPRRRARLRSTGFGCDLTRVPTAECTGQLTVPLGRELPRHSFTGRIHLNYHRFAIPRPRPDLHRRYPQKW